MLRRPEIIFLHSVLPCISAVVTISVLIVWLWGEGEETSQAGRLVLFKATCCYPLLSM